MVDVVVTGKGDYEFSSKEFLLCALSMIKYSDLFRCSMAQACLWHTLIQ